MGRVIALALLLAQAPFEGEEELERARRLAEPSRPATGIITLIARYEDGSPVRGWIGCEGFWWKHQDCPDEDDCVRVGAVGYMFLTDSRGHMILNPRLSDFSWEWECIARDRVGREGSSVHAWVNGGQHVITIRRHP